MRSRWMAGVERYLPVQVVLAFSSGCGCDGFNFCECNFQIVHLPCTRGPVRVYLSLPVESDHRPSVLAPNNARGSSHFAMALQVRPSSRSAFLDRHSLSAPHTPVDCPQSELPVDVMRQQAVAACDARPREANTPRVHAWLEPVSAAVHYWSFIIIALNLLLVFSTTTPQLA